MPSGLPRVRLAYLALLSFAAYANTWTTFYVLPRVHDGYGFGGQASLLLFVTTIVCLLLATYPVGWLSDRTGRRAPLLYGSLAVIGVTTILSAFASDYRLAMVIAVVSGLGSAGISSVFFALLCDLTERSHRATVAGVVDAVSLVPAVLIWTVAPSLPAVPVQAAMGLVPLVGLLVCRRLEPAALAEAPRQGEAAETPPPRGARALAGCPLALILGMVGWGLHGSLSDAPFKAGFGAVGLFETAWVARVLLYLAMFVVGGVLADRFGRIVVWSGGFLLRAGGAVLFASLAPPLLWAGTLLVGLGHINDGLGMMIFGEWATTAHRARAFAAAYVAYLAGNVVSLVASSRVDPVPAGLLGACASVFAAAAVWPLRRHETAASPSPANPPDSVPARR